MMATRQLCLVVAALLPLSSSSGLYQFTASLFGGASSVSPADGGGGGGGGAPRDVRMPPSATRFPLGEMSKSWSGSILARSSYALFVSCIALEASGIRHW